VLSRFSGEKGALLDRVFRGAGSRGTPFALEGSVGWLKLEGQLK